MVEPLGRRGLTLYLPNDRTLMVNEPEAQRIREIYRLYLELGCVRRLKAELDQRGWTTPVRKSRRDNMGGGRPFSRGHLYLILGNPIYIGQIVHKEARFPGQHPGIIDEALWQAVQDRLAANLNGQRGPTNAKGPSLLTGLAFDTSGERLAPNHTKKGARRYRYYVGQAETADSKDECPQRLRWPAQELEDAVLQALAKFLTDETRLLELMGATQARETQTRLQAAARQAKQLTGLVPADRSALIKHLVIRITVQPTRLEIAVRSGAIGSSNEVADDDQVALIDVPVVRKLCGKAVRLIVHASGEPQTRTPDDKMIALLAKAHEWFAKLTLGEHESVYAIAKGEGLTRAHVTKVINLAFLSPDIIERILCGRHPENLNAGRLIRMVPLPMTWAQQRVRLGMTQSAKQ